MSATLKAVTCGADLYDKNRKGYTQEQAEMVKASFDSDPCDHEHVIVDLLRSCCECGEQFKPFTTRQIRCTTCQVTSDFG